MSAVMKDAPFFLRPMKLDDLDTIMSLEKKLYPFPWTRQIFQDCIRVGYTCRVCEIDKQIVGYSVMSLGASEAHVLNISIASEFQGQGLGRQLLLYMLELAHGRHTDTVFLEVRPSNQVALHLYEKVGFVQIGTRKDYYPARNGREDAIILAKHLEKPQSPVPKPPVS